MFSPMTDPFILIYVNFVVLELGFFVENSYMNKRGVRVSVTSVKTSSVMSGASESATPLTFPRFYWNVTCIPELKHNYIHSQGPTLNVLDGVLSHSFILLWMHTNSLCNNFHRKVLIITDTWIIKCNFRQHLCRNRQDGTNYCYYLRIAI